MNYLITIVVFILVFSLLILVHEFGHFIVAKRNGIKVEEFGIGLPPRIWGKKKGDTIYSINWIPFGGFVRMLGEDATDPAMLRKRRSFAAKSMRVRFKVIVAGVLMNFLLAWILLSSGFAVGMQPLLGPDDVLGAVDEGVIELVEGLKVKNVVEESIAEQIGMKAGDVIYSFNGEEVDSFTVGKVVESPIGLYRVVRGGEMFTYEVFEEQVEGMEEVSLGLEFYDFVPFPRVRIFELEKGSEAYKMGLRADDVILTVNGSQVYSVDDFEELVRGVEEVEYEIYRDGFREKFMVEMDQTRKVIVSEVLPDSPAQEAGLMDGDVILSVNGNKVADSLELIEFVEEHSDENLAYLVGRNGQTLFYEIKPEDGRIGVLLSELMSYGEQQEMSLYNVNQLSSVLEIKEEQYPVHVAVYKAFGESFRLAKLTGKMFVGFVIDFVSDGEVPETVAGPVGIAQLTHVFVQEGVVPVIRFVAILSLSLAVINILPFPALDGGRLLFILIELIIGRRVNQRWESVIHALGYGLILLLILAVTYSDIMRLIS